MRVDKTAPEMEKQLIKCDNVPQRVHCIPGERVLANEGDPCVLWDGKRLFPYLKPPLERRAWEGNPITHIDSLSRTAE